jgi:hypothetical protein
VEGHVRVALHQYHLLRAIAEIKTAYYGVSGLPVDDKRLSMEETRLWVLKQTLGLSHCMVNLYLANTAEAADAYKTVIHSGASHLAIVAPLSRVELGHLGWYFQVILQIVKGSGWLKRGDAQRLLNDLPAQGKHATHDRSLLASALAAFRVSPVSNLDRQARITDHG